jgi:hypothetical protein
MSEPEVIATIAGTDANRPSMIPTTLKRIEFPNPAFQAFEIAGMWTIVGPD